MHAYLAFLQISEHKLIVVYLDNIYADYHFIAYVYELFTQIKTMPSSCYSG
jgi:hypothetical protein